MLEKFKPGITFFSIFTIIAVLFPPYVWNVKGLTLKEGFGFLLSPPTTSEGFIASLNIPQLIVEIIFIFILAVLFQLNYKKIKTWLRNNI